MNTDHVAATGDLPGRLQSSLVARRDAGHKLLVPYVTGGMDDQWLLTLEALAGSGADAIEVGIPFSDPMIDGPTIQEASLRALERGSTPDGILADLSRIDVGVPLVVMTYYNLVFRAGHDRMAGIDGRVRGGRGHRPRPSARGARSLVGGGRRGRGWPRSCWWRRPPLRTGSGRCASDPVASSTRWDGWA